VSARTWNPMLRPAGCETPSSDRYSCRSETPH